MENFKYDQVESASVDIAIGQAEGEIKIKGNKVYDRLVGYIVIVEKADGSIYTKKMRVSVANTGNGTAVLPLQPYHCIRPSFAEKPDDRIIKCSEKATNQDFRFRIEPVALAEALTFTVVAYFTNSK